MTFVAGQKIRAADLNAGQPLYGRVTSDVTVISTTTQVNATGLSVALEANATYALEGWVYYESTSAADIKFGVTGPAGYAAVISWKGPPVSGAPFAGTSPRINYVDQGAFAPGNYTLGGDTEFAGVWVASEPKGFITTGSTAGTFQVIFAQATSTAVNTKVKVGSWIRVARMA